MTAQTVHRGRLAFTCALNVWLLLGVIAEQAEAQSDMARQTVLFSLPTMDAVVTRTGVVYKPTTGGNLTMDIYYPPDADGVTPLPVVVFGLGYSDAAAIRLAGVKLKDMASYTSWARLAAASGMIGVTYETEAPEADLRDLISFLRSQAQELGVDGGRIALWSCSGNVPVSLSYLMQHAGPEVRAGVFYYGLMPTPDRFQEREIAAFAREFGFVASDPGSLDRLRTDVPIFIARAGRDDLPPINPSIDRFTQTALTANMPLTLVNYPAGRHAFDILDDTLETRALIGQTLAFLRAHLMAPVSAVP